MDNNPELQYLNHVQNTSMSKHCFRFAKAPRFHQHRGISTDFNYNPKLTNHARSCSFGFGNRASYGTLQSSPSPNKYNVSKFPANQRATSIGFGRQDAVFGTFALQIKQRAKMPPPGSYQPQSSIINRKFTIRKKLKTQFQLNRMPMPGPGEYEPIGINKDGKFPTSTIKNVRYVFVDSYKQIIEPKVANTGPASYDVLSTSAFSNTKIQKMRSTTSKPFGTQKRKGPQQSHRLFVPGPGMYDTFSSFGQKKSSNKARFNTQY